MFRSDEREQNGVGGARSRTPRDKRITSVRALVAHWREDYEANGRKLMRPGFQAVAVYRYGVWTDGVRSRLLRWPLRKLYLVMYVFVRNVYGIEIFSTVRAGRRLRIGHQNGIVIHKNVTIGDDCLVRHNVTIGIARRGVPRDDVPVIGDRVAIGVGAVILSPARIGDDAIIGPNVVVRSHVPANAVVMPAAPEIRQHSRPRVAPDVD